MDGVQRVYTKEQTDEQKYRDSKRKIFFYYQMHETKQTESVILEQNA